MDEEDIQEELARVQEIGLENLAILTLAANWCENIDVTKGPMGTGMVELATGLPITGGSLRCQYAQAPTMFGMVLQHTAVDFYERDCIGCAHHKPTGRTPTLSTWADEVIAKRNEAARLAEDERQRDAERRRLRWEHRRLLLGAPDPSVQAILDLVERIDAEEQDPEAERLLLTQAELSPADFPDSLLEHLAAEAMSIGRAPLLAVVVKVFEQSGRPNLNTALALAFAAVREGIGAADAGRVIAAHANQFPDDDGVAAGIVRLAAGFFNFHSADWTGGHQDALVRFFDVEPGRAIDALSKMLRNEEPWARAVAAHAAKALANARPAAGPSLLPALLDCVVMPDKSRYHGDPFAAGTAANVVGDLITVDPEPTDAAVAARIHASGVREGRALWKCYWSATPSRFRGPVRDNVLGLLERRAVALLREDLPLGLLDNVAETLSHLTDDFDGGTGTPLNELVQLTLDWSRKLDAFDTTRPAGPTSEPTLLASLEWSNERLRVGGIIRNLEEALEGRAKRGPAAYLAAVRPVWMGDGGPTLTDGERSTLLKGLRSIRRQEDLVEAEPLLVGVLSTGETLERGEALRVLQDVAAWGVDLPQAIQDQVISNLGHERQWVVLGAIRALQHVTVPAADTPRIVEFLLNFCTAYLGKPAQSDDVERALWLAIHLASDQPYSERVRELAIGIIHQMPATDAADAMLHIGALRGGPTWVAAIVGALTNDERPEWYSVHEGQKDDLLELLAEAPTEWLDPSWDAIEAAAEKDLDLDGVWTWAVADVLARHSQHERAARLCQAVVDATPDTTERRPRRRLAILVTYAHRINAAAGDPTAAMTLLAQAIEVASQEPPDA